MSKKIKYRNLFLEVKYDGNILKYNTTKLGKCLCKIGGFQSWFELPINSLLFIQKQSHLFQPMQLFVHKHNPGGSSLKYFRMNVPTFFSKQLKMLLEQAVEQVIEQNLSRVNVMLYKVKQADVLSFYSKRYSLYKSVSSKALVDTAVAKYYSFTPQPAF